MSQVRRGQGYDWECLHNNGPPPSIINNNIYSSSHKLILLIRLEHLLGDEGITPPQAFHRSCNRTCSIIKSKFNTDSEQLTK
jgi:hypothetical protein